MRSSLFLLALTAANGVIATRIPSANYVDKATDVALYLNDLTPVAKDVLLTKLEVCQSAPTLVSITSPPAPPTLDVNVAFSRSVALS